MYQAGGTDMNVIRRARAALVAALIVTVLAGCTQSADGPDYSEFEGITWELASGAVDGDALPDPIALPVTITFEEADGAMRFLGLACNSLMGRIEGWPHGFSLRDFGQTERGCPNDNMLATEEALAEGIVRVSQLQGDSSTVTLSGDGVEFILRAADEVDRQGNIVAALGSVIGRKWQLTSGSIDGSALQVSAGALAMSVTRNDQSEPLLSLRGCNTWSVPLDALKTGPVASTQILCDMEVDLETPVVASLSRLTAVEVGERTLTFWGDGVELHWDEL